MLVKIAGDRVEVTTQCPMGSELCEGPKDFVFSLDQWSRYFNGAAVQDVFPELTPGDRERFVTGTCEKCWDYIFSGTEIEDF